MRWIHIYTLVVVPVLVGICANDICMQQRMTIQHTDTRTLISLCASFATSFTAFSAKGTEPKQHQLLDWNAKYTLCNIWNLQKDDPECCRFVPSSLSVMSQTTLACATKGQTKWTRDGSDVDRWTWDWKVLGWTPDRSSRRHFFSRVNFLCQLFQYLFHPCVTAVACKRSQSFCQKCRWQVSAQCTCILCTWLWVRWQC